MSKAEAWREVREEEEEVVVAGHFLLLLLVRLLERGAEGRRKAVLTPIMHVKSTTPLAAICLLNAPSSLLVPAMSLGGAK